VSTDENLLFGVLALQADFIDAARFAEACSAWAGRKGAALADLLVERGWLTEQERADVEKFVRRKLDKHRGDARAGLAEVTTDEVRHSLASVADAGVQKSLAEMPCPPSPGVVPTTAHEAAERGRYRLVNLHAQGGIGQVWLARDEAIGRDVALKELRLERRDHPAARSRFLEEARVTGQLEHPGIVPVHELAHGADGSAFYVMRMVRGRTLGEAIKDHHTKRQEKKAGPLELRALLSSFVAVCNAVAYAHSRGVLHRDLKPSNVILGDFGEVIVLDWGLAKLVGKPDQEATGLLPVSVEAGSRDETIQGQVLGTPGFMAPEQAEGRLDLLGPASDVYGLGAVLYQILTGSPPFDGGDTPTLLRRVVREEPQRPRLRVPATSRALEAVCLKALAKKPKDRYASAAELAKEVERWLADEPVRAWREPVRARAGRWVRRHQTLVTGLAVGLLVCVLLGGVAGAWWSGERQKQRASAGSSLERFATLLGQGRLGEARAALEQARSHLGASAPADLLARLRRAEADLDLAERLDAVRADRARLAGSEVNRDGAARGYAAAFADAGLGEPGDAPEEVAARVRASAARAALLAALDAWAYDAAGDRRVWVLSVARAADPDPQRDRLRDPALWRDKGALARAVAEVDGAGLSPNLACALGWLLAGQPEAEALLRQAQRARPGDFWLALSLGEALVKRKEYLEADGYFLVAVALRPDAAFPLTWHGFALASLGRHAEAEKAYRKAIEIDPSNANAHVNLGIALQSQGKWDEAEKAYRMATEIDRKATEIDRNFAPAHVHLGLALLRRGEKAEAEKAFRKAIEIDRNLAPAHVHLGLALLRRGEKAEAEKAFRKAIEIDPSNASAHIDLGSALQQQGKWAEAEKACRKGLDLGYNNPFLREKVRLMPRMAVLHPKLPAYLSGDLQPADNDDRLALAYLCVDERLDAGTVRFYADALEADPKLAEKPSAGYLRDRAITAALAAARGDAVGDGEKARLRGLALRWLRAELAVWGERLANGKDADRDLVKRVLSSWPRRPDLADVRDEKALAALPEGERKAWADFWADVVALEAKAVGK
jgi:serine/threonine-protein kinase